MGGGVDWREWKNAHRNDMKGVFEKGIRNRKKKYFSAYTKQGYQNPYKWNSRNQTDQRALTSIERLE